MQFFEFLLELTVKMKEIHKSKSFHFVGIFVLKASFVLTDKKTDVYFFLMILHLSSIHEF